eukprot:scaffold75394_cov50-Phaeocystis_antarctica.AAC.1
MSTSTRWSNSVTSTSRSGCRLVTRSNLTVCRREALLKPTTCPRAQLRSALRQRTRWPTSDSSTETYGSEPSAMSSRSGFCPREGRPPLARCRAERLLPKARLTGE